MTVELTRTFEPACLSVVPVRLPFMTKSTAGESPEHAALKHALAEAARVHGWSARVEATMRSRARADVAATSSDGRRTVALEAQYSPQALSAFRKRSDRYAADGVRYAWFVGTAPRGSHASDIPFVATAPRQGTAGERTELTTDPAQWMAQLPISEFARKSVLAQPVPLNQLVGWLLGGSLSRRNPRAATRRVVVAWKSPCWRCSSDHVVWSIEPYAIANCDRCPHEWSGTPEEHATVLWSATVTDRPEARMNVIEAVSAVLAEHRTQVPLARIGQITSKTAGEYIGFTCRSCDAVYGDWFLHSERMEVLVGRPYGAPDDGYSESYWHALLPPGPATSTGWHWCATGDATSAVQRPSPHNE